MKVLYAAVMYDYNDKKRGLGLDFYSTYPALKSMKDIETILFDCSDFKDMQIQEKNNANLIRLVEEERPDILFHSAFTDQIKKETYRYLKENTKTTTLNWFSDDAWRFDVFTKEMCWYFDYSITADKDSVRKYNLIGYKNVILSQFAATPETYPKLDLSHIYDVSFVGQPHGDRRETIKRIRDEKINISTFGYGWKEVGFKKRWNKRFKNFPILQFDKGKISHEEMVRVFNQSKINLNLAASSVENSLDQIKARNFEVPCCGGFLLTKRVPHLGDYYEIDKEIACYENVDDMIEKIKYYLTHEDERKTIAKAGYERTIRDHTYQRRFRDIFGQIKLKK